MLTNTFQAFHTIRCDGIFYEERIIRLQQFHHTDGLIGTKPLVKIIDNSHIGAHSFPHTAEIIHRIINFLFGSPVLHNRSTLIGVHPKGPATCRHACTKAKHLQAALFNVLICPRCGNSTGLCPAPYLPVICREATPRTFQ